MLRTNADGECLRLMCFARMSATNVQARMPMANVYDECLRLMCKHECLRRKSMTNAVGECLSDCTSFDEYSISDLVPSGRCVYIYSMKNTFLFISLMLFSTFGFAQDTLQEPRMFVQEMPAYPAGDEVMIREILKYVVYPEQEKLMKIEGTVKVRFVVEKDGTPSNFEVIQGVVGAPRLDDAALFACKQLGKFNPGKQDDIPQRVYRIIPIKFSLP